MTLNSEKQNLGRETTNLQTKQPMFSLEGCPLVYYAFYWSSVNSFLLLKDFSRCASPVGNHQLPFAVSVLNEQCCGTWESHSGSGRRSAGA